MTSVGSFATTGDGDDMSTMTGLSNLEDADTMFNLNTDSYGTPARSISCGTRPPELRG